MCDIERTDFKKDVNTFFGNLARKALMVERRRPKSSLIKDASGTCAGLASAFRLAS